MTKKKNKRVHDDYIWFLRWVKQRYLRRQLEVQNKMLSDELETIKTLLDQKATNERLDAISKFNKNHKPKKKNKIK